MPGGSFEETIPPDLRAFGLAVAAGPDLISARGMVAGVAAARRVLGVDAAGGAAAVAGFRAAGFRFEVGAAAALTVAAFVVAGLVVGFGFAAGFAGMPRPSVAFAFVALVLAIAFRLLFESSIGKSASTSGTGNARSIWTRPSVLRLASEFRAFCKERAAKWSSAAPLARSNETGISHSSQSASGGLSERDETRIEIQSLPTATAEIR